jgi:predicted DNA-binding antitoxin AbrB/MazE fold protein
MEKILNATYDGEVFRPDEPIDLEPDTKVEITLKIKNSKKTGKPYSSLEFMASLKLDGPSDFSRNIDEYLYGGKSLDDE